MSQFAATVCDQCGHQIIGMHVVVKNGNDREQDYCASACLLLRLQGVPAAKSFIAARV